MHCINTIIGIMVYTVHRIMIIYTYIKYILYEMTWYSMYVEGLDWPTEQTPNDCVYIVWWRTKIENRSTYYSLNSWNAFTSLNCFVTFLRLLLRSCVKLITVFTSHWDGWNLNVVEISYNFDIFRASQLEHYSLQFVEYLTRRGRSKS